MKHKQKFLGQIVYISIVICDGAWILIKPSQRDNRLDSALFVWFLGLCIFLFGIVWGDKLEGFNSIFASKKAKEKIRRHPGLITRINSWIFLGLFTYFAYSF